jgi:hypothetical protein
MKLSHLLTPLEDKDEYVIDDFDSSKGWHWKDVDHLLDMGFTMDGETRLKLDDKKEYDETLNVEIFKQKSTNHYIMLINGRRHVFNNFVDMINFIEDKQIEAEHPDKVASATQKDKLKQDIKPI